MNRKGYSRLSAAASNTNPLLIPLWLIAAALNKGAAEWSCLGVAVIVAILSLVDKILECKKIKQPNDRR
jgi:hypothetical protein